MSDVLTPGPAKKHSADPTAARVVLSARDIQAMYGVSHQTAYDWMLAARTDPATRAVMYRVGRIRRIDKTGFLRWLAGKEV